MEILDIADFVGLFAFAITGVLAAMRKKLDFVGIAFCGLATAIGGGILRDAILGVRAESFFNTNILLFVISTIVLGYFGTRNILKIKKIIPIADAIGLASFTVVGTQKALELNAPIVAAILLGVMTGVGGGIIREVALQNIPVLFRKELYAIGAIIGGTGFAVFQTQNIFTLKTNLIVWASFIFIFRLYTIRHNVHLPIKELKE